MTEPLYALRIDPEGLARARLEWPPGRPLAELLLLSSAHAPGRVDELVEVMPVDVRAVTSEIVEIAQVARSTLWPRKRVVLRSYGDRLEYWLELEGRGAIDELAFFEAGEVASGYSNRVSPSGFWRPPRARAGWQGSRAYVGTVFNPAPNGAFRQYAWVGERSTIHPGNESSWGGDWFFTPAPFVYGLGDDERWLMLGLGCTAEAATFFHYDFHGGPIWGLGLSYQGYTQVDGIWRSPRVVLLPVKDPYDGLVAYVRWLEREGLCSPAPAGGPAWWQQPIWCGWGEQVAHEGARPARELCTEANCAAWLQRLEERGIVPGTIVIDDRWMARLGFPEPHPQRWPRLAEFIAARQARGQRVLLWHNAWEIEADPGTDGLIWHGDAPARGAFGQLLLDPTSPAAERHLRALLTRLLAPPPHGLGADGLKIDITHSTPCGPGYRLAGSAWGNALLHRLLALTRRLAKEVRPEALIECHAANPLFRETADMLRLNDLHTDLLSVVDLMEHRARVARAAGWELIDTDGWPMPSRAALQEYVRRQPCLGVPALYYASRLDQSGETLLDDDYRLIAAAWADYRRAHGLPVPAAG